MTEDRYKIVFLNGLDGLCSIEDTEAEIPTFYNDLGYINHIKPVCDLLNSQEEIIQEQKEYLTRMGQGNHLKIIMEQKERIKELEQENKRLKQGKYVYGIHGGSND